MKKKIYCMLLTCALILSLVACGTTNEVPSPTDPVEKPTASVGDTNQEDATISEGNNDVVAPNEETNNGDDKISEGNVEPEVPTPVVIPTETPSPTDPVEDTKPTASVENSNEEDSTISEGNSEPTATPAPTATPTPVPHVHDYETTVVKPTYTADGYTTYTCDCGDSYIADEVSKLEYTYTDLTATKYAKSSVNVRDLPSTDGNKVGKLSANEKVTVTGKCKETGWYRIEFGKGVAYVSDDYLIDALPTPTPVPHKHDFKVTETKKATCDEAGYTVSECACGETKRETVKAQHDYGKYTYNKDNTKTENGTKTATCTLCGYVDTQEVPWTAWYNTRVYEVLDTTMYACYDGYIKGTTAPIYDVPDLQKKKGIGTIPQGTSVKVTAVYDRGDLFYEVTYSGKTGYTPGYFLSETVPQKEKITKNPDAKYDENGLYEAPYPIHHATGEPIEFCKMYLDEENMMVYIYSSESHPLEDNIYTLFHEFLIDKYGNYGEGWEEATRNLWNGAYSSGSKYILRDSVTGKGERVYYAFMPFKLVE